MQRRALLVGNWKMNGLVESAKNLTHAISSGLAQQISNQQQSCEVVICPPFTGLASIYQCLENSPVKLGGQTMSEYESGAFTGEISAAMLRDVGCQYVILGHSERRTLFGETNKQVAAKMVTALNHDLTPIICLGESLQERDAGHTLQVIESQLAALFPHLAKTVTENKPWVLAYEPVWAIGTGRTASPQQAQEVHAFIRQQLHTHLSATVASKTGIIYGGSVKAKNATEIFSQEDVDGGLIGGASLTAADFLAIIDAYPKSI